MFVTRKNSLSSLSLGEKESVSTIISTFISRFIELFFKVVSCFAGGGSAVGLVFIGCGVGDGSGTLAGGCEVGSGFFVGSLDGSDFFSTSCSFVSLTHPKNKIIIINKIRSPIPVKIS